VKLNDIERRPATGEGFKFQPGMHSRGNVYVHETARVEESAVLGDGTIVWAMAYVMGSSRIGARCMLGQGVHVGTLVTIGNGCSIQNGAQVFTGVTLEDDVFLGPHCTFTNVLTPRAFQRAPRLKRTLVKRGVSIGANATVLCGITIGEYAMIGAGAVVTKNVRPHALVVGNPAKETALVCRCGQRFPHISHAPTETTVVAPCAACGQRTRFNFSQLWPYDLDRVEPLDAP
jgi:acetyltransferase-like isoleucine patch superfamily enzyme